MASLFLFFFFNDTATTEIYTLSLHDALPIYGLRVTPGVGLRFATPLGPVRLDAAYNGYPSEPGPDGRSEEHTSELPSRSDLVCRLLLEKKKKKMPQCKSHPRIRVASRRASAA